MKDLGPKIFRAGLRGDVRFRVSTGQMMMLFIDTTSIQTYHLAASYDDEIIS